MHKVHRLRWILTISFRNNFNSIQSTACESQLVSCLKVRKIYMFPVNSLDINREEFVERRYNFAI